MFIPCPTTLGSRFWAWEKRTLRISAVRPAGSISSMSRHFPLTGLSCLVTVANVGLDSGRSWEGLSEGSI